MFDLNTNNAADTTNANGAAKGTNDNWKSQGFINVFLPTKGGGKIKLGFIGLQDKVEREKELRLFLEADPANIGILASKLIIEYNSAQPSEANKFDLSA
jgi:hypothetical protein